MSAGDLVSVVIPAYDAAATIGDALQSALAQTHHRLEILVVDDGSRDRTIEVVQRTAAGDSRVRIVRLRHAGANAARNAGLAVAKGELIACLDADDLWQPEKLALQVARFHEAGPRVGLVYAWSWFVDEGGCCIPGVYCAFGAEGDVLAAQTVDNLPGNGSSALIRRACLRAVGGWPDDAVYGCDDVRLYLALAARTEFAVVPRFLVGYRERRDSKSQDVARIRRSHAVSQAETRRVHPWLPPRLLRWSRAKLDHYLAQKSLRLGRPAEALAPTIDLLIHDPLLLADRALGRAFPRGDTATGSPDPGGRPFLPLPAGLERFVPAAASRLEARRQAYVARITRPSAGSPPSGVAENPAHGGRPAHGW